MFFPAFQPINLNHRPIQPRFEATPRTSESPVRMTYAYADKMAKAAYRELKDAERANWHNTKPEEYQRLKARSDKAHQVRDELKAQSPPIKKEFERETVARGRPHDTKPYGRRYADPGMVVGTSRGRSRSPEYRTRDFKHPRDSYYRSRDESYSREGRDYYRERDRSSRQDHYLGSRRTSYDRDPYERGRDYSPDAREYRGYGEHERITIERGWRRW